jgi:hypothetical protein
MIHYTQVDSYPHEAEELSRREWDPTLAALPHLWMGATLCLALLDGNVMPGLPDQTLATIADISLVLFLATGLIIAGYAARNDHPLWSASWSGYTLLALAAVPGRMIVMQNDAYWIYQIGFLLLAALALMISYFLRFRRQPLHALLMVLVCLLLGPLFFLDAIPYTVEVLFAIFLALLAAFAAALAVIVRQWAISAAVAMGASLLAGLVLALVRTYQIEPSGAISGGLLMSAWVFLSGSLLSLVILFGPWLFWSAADSVRRKFV